MTALSERFEVRRRFLRSVHLGLDAVRPDACDGYVLTAVGRATLLRILDALAPNGLARAWSLTGPYGAGKSAFVVFLTQLLRRTPVEVLALLRAADPGSTEVAARLERVRRGDRGFCSLLVTATFGPLIPALLDAIESAAKARHGARAQRLLHEARALRLARGRSVELHRRVVALVADLAHDTLGSGLVIVLDELGKTLEHATRGSARADDVHLLQELAELAARSGSTPILIVTLLHQSFDRYARALSAQTRSEWAKVQGRFEDVAFLDAPSELLRIAAQSIHRREGAAPEAFARYDILAREAVALGLAPPDQEPSLRALAPIHPTVALLLPALFRGPLAQNERSLFDFLTSDAPDSFGDFVATARCPGAPAYTLDKLYDFITATLGPAQFAGPDGRRWAAIDDVLCRLDGRCPPRTPALVKSIGILSLLGTRAVRASRDALRFALDVNDATEVDRSLDSLRGASHIVYRRHSDAFALWEGSDIDLDARFDHARRRTPALDALSDVLRARMVLRPRLARRHFIETGTLRYFDVALATPDAAWTELDPSTYGADGRIVYLLPSGEESPRDLIDLAARAAREPNLVIGVPDEAPALVSAVRDWCAWESVRSGGADLDSDPVARRELASRIRAVSSELEARVQACFGVGDDTAVAWVRRGAVQPWRGARGVCVGLSAACDDAYDQGPRLRNELLNRRTLSTAATAARRALLDAMIAAGGRPRLGLEGSPPEWSMYACLLSEGGIHRERAGRWGFGPPPPEDPLRLAPTWQVIERFLDDADAGARPLRELFAALARRPIGLREGPAPVLFFAVVLAAPGEVALFEDGTFVAELSGPVIERLLRRIDHFSVARYRVTGARAAALEALKTVVAEGAASPVDLARVIVRRVSLLPRYTRGTRRVASLGLAAREAIMSARDPLQLLFFDLPRALGLPGFGSDAPGDETAPGRYAAGLHDALTELAGVYPALLATVESTLARSIGLDAETVGAREALSARAQRLTSIAVDLKLRAFLGRASAAGEHSAWIEGVATVVNNRHPSEWSDGELARFEQGVEELFAMMRRAEALTAPATPPITEVSAEDAPMVDAAEREILRVLTARLGGRRDTWLAALGRTIQRVLDTPRGDGAREEETL